MLKFQANSDKLLTISSSNLLKTYKNEVIHQIVIVNQLIGKYVSAASTDQEPQKLHTSSKAETGLINLGDLSTLEKDVVNFENYFLDLQNLVIEKLVNHVVNLLQNLDSDSCYSVKNAYYDVMDQLHVALNGYNFKNLIAGQAKIQALEAIPMQEFHDFSEAVSATKNQLAEQLSRKKRQIESAINDQDTIILFTQTILSLAQIDYNSLTPAEQDIFTTQVEIIMNSLAGIFQVTAEIGNLDFSNFKALVDDSPFGDILTSINNIVFNIDELTFQFQNLDSPAVDYDLIQGEILLVRQEIIQILNATATILDGEAVLLEDLIYDLTGFNVEELIVQGLILDGQVSGENLENFFQVLLPNLGFDATASATIASEIGNSYQAVLKFLDQLKYFEDESPVVEALFYLPDMLTVLVPEIDDVSVKSFYDSVIKAVYDFDSATKSNTLASEIGQAAIEGIFEHMRQHGVEIENFKERIANLTEIFILYGQGKATVDELMLVLIENTAFEGIYLDSLAQFAKIENTWNILVENSVYKIFNAYIPEWQEAETNFERYEIAGKLPDAISYSWNTFLSNFGNLLGDTFEVGFIVWENIDKLFGASFVDPHYRNYWEDLVSQINSADDLWNFMQQAGDDLGYKNLDMSKFQTWFNYLSGFKDQSLFTSYETMKMLSEIVTYEKLNKDKSVAEQVEIIFSGNHIGMFMLRVESLVRTDGLALGDQILNYVQLVEDVVQVGVSPFFGFWKAMQTSVYQECTGNAEKYMKIYDTGYESLRLFNKWTEIWAKDQPNYRKVC